MVPTRTGRSLLRGGFVPFAERIRSPPSLPPLFFSTIWPPAIAGNGIPFGGKGDLAPVAPFLAAQIATVVRLWQMCCVQNVVAASSVLGAIRKAGDSRKLDAFFLKQKDEFSAQVPASFDGSRVGKANGRAVAQLPMSTHQISPRHNFDANRCPF